MHDATTHSSLTSRTVYAANHKHIMKVKSLNVDFSQTSGEKGTWNIFRVNRRDDLLPHLHISHFQLKDSSLCSPVAPRTLKVS